MSSDSMSNVYSCVTYTVTDTSCLRETMKDKHTQYNRYFHTIVLLVNYQVQDRKPSTSRAQRKETLVIYLVYSNSLHMSLKTEVMLNLKNLVD